MALEPASLLCLQWIQFMFQDNRQFQIEELLDSLMFGSGGDGQINGAPLSTQEVQMLKEAIFHVWTYVQQHDAPVELVGGIWGLLSLKFPRRNGAHLFSLYHRMHKQLLEQLHIESSHFAGELLKITSAATLEGFSRKCRMLSLNQHELLSDFNVQMVKEETITVTRDETLVPYIGEPLFEQEYLSEPGSLYNDLLSTFTIKEYKDFEQHMSLHNENCSAENQLEEWEDLEDDRIMDKQRKRKIRNFEPISEGQYRLEIDNQKNNRKARRRHRRPSNRRLKMKLLEYQQKQRIETQSEVFKKKLQKRQKKQQKKKPAVPPPRNQAFMMSEMEDEDSPPPVKRRNKKRRVQCNDSEEESYQRVPEARPEEQLVVEEQSLMNKQSQHAPRQKKKRFELYRVRKLATHDEELQVTYSQPVRELLSIAVCQLRLLTRPEKLTQLMVKLAFIYFSRDQLKSDDLALLTATYCLYSTARNHAMEVLVVQLGGMLLAMMQSCFVKLVATVTNVLTGTAESELALPVRILAEFNRIIEAEESLRQQLNLGGCISQFFNDLLTPEGNSDNNMFFERSSLKVVYSTCCENEEHSKLAPLKVSVVVSTRLAELFLLEKGMFRSEQFPPHRKNLMRQYKKFLQQISNSRINFLEFWMQLDKLYPRGLFFEEWEVIFSFAQPPPEQQTSLSDVDSSFTSSTLQRFLEDELTRTKNYKNMLNKVLKQTFLARVKTRPTRPLVECYFSTVATLLDNELFRNEFVYREVLIGLEVKKHIECGRSFQDLLLRILKYSVEANQTTAVKLLEGKQQLGLSAGTQECYKSLIGWLGALFSVLDDNLKHLSILRRPELIEKVKNQVEILCTLFRSLFVGLQEDMGLHSRLELWVVRHRLLLEETHLAAMFKKSDEQYNLLKLEVLHSVATHLRLPLKEVDLSQDVAGECLSDQDDELIELHRQMKLGKVLEDALRQLLRTGWTKCIHILDYKCTPSKTANPQLMQRELHLTGVLFGFRLWSGRSTLEELDRYMSQLVDRNFNIYHESFGRLAGLQFGGQLYRNMLNLLMGYNTKLSFGETTLKLFYQCILCLQILIPEEQDNGQINVVESLLVVATDVRQPIACTNNTFWQRLNQLLRGRPITVQSTIKIAIELECNEPQLEELVRLLEKDIKLLRQFYKDKQLPRTVSGAAAKLLCLFGMLLNSRRNFNKSIQVLTQLFRARDNEFLNSNSLLVLCVQEDHSNYAVLLEFLERLEQYPSNIYKIKSISEQYMRWLATSYSQFVTFNYSTVSYEELLANRFAEYPSELEMFLQAVVEYCLLRGTTGSVKFFRNLVGELLQTLWDIQKGIDQHRELLILRVLTLGWLKMRIPELAPVVEQFTFANLSSIVTLLMSIPYECQSAQWLFRGPLLTGNRHSNPQLLKECAIAAQKLGLRQDTVKLEME